MSTTRAACLAPTLCFVIAFFSACGSNSNTQPAQSAEPQVQAGTDTENNHAQSPTDSEPTLGQLAQFIGVWQAVIESSNAARVTLINEFSVAVRADGTMTQYDYQGDEAGSGFDCYIPKNGSLSPEQVDDDVAFIREDYESVVFTNSEGITTIKFSTVETPATPSLIAESDLSPLCGSSEFPYSRDDVPWSPPSAFRTRFAYYPLAPPVTCPPLTGSTDVGEIAGVWDFLSISGNLRSDRSVLGLIIIHDQRLVRISQLGEILNYDVQNYTAPQGRCYDTIETGAAVLTKLSGSRFLATYYKDNSCELVENEIRLERFSNLPRSNDLLSYTYLGGETAQTQLLRFPEVGEKILSEMLACSSVSAE